MKKKSTFIEYFRDLSIRWELNIQIFGTEALESYGSLPYREEWNEFFFISLFNLGGTTEFIVFVLLVLIG